MKHPYLVKLRFLLLLTLGLTASLGAWAQADTGSVSGRVTDAKNEGLPGVTVLVEGTSIGGSTNADGAYTIGGVPAGPHTLVISFIGFTTARVPVTVAAGQTATVPAQTLGENATALGEAVVIGYGTQRRQDLTGAVEQIDAKQFVKGQVTSPEQLVQGKVAGVQITTGGGAPGAASQILIRGGSSLSASNQPLIIIDGVPVDNAGLAGASNPLSLINPNDIESITVLKDASSTAIYGVRASNGVIIVTTKRGVQGDSFHANISTQQSIATPVKYVDVLDADQFRTLVNAKGSASQKASLGTANTNWQREIYRNAYTADNNVSISGAAGILPYRISTGYLYQEGLLKRNDLKRYTGALTLNPVLLDGSLRVTLNLKGSWIDNNFSDQGAIGSAVQYDPTQPVTSDDPRYAKFGGYYQFLDPSNSGNLNSLAIRNPVALINQRRDRSTVRRSIGNVQLDYKLPFVPGLSANVNLGYDVQRGRGSLNAPATAAAYYGQGGVNNFYHQDLDNTLLEAYGKYERNFWTNSKVELLAGYSYQKFQNRHYLVNNNSADGTVFQQPVAPAYNGEFVTSDVNVLESYYSRLNVGFSEKYLFTGTIRRDATSRFAPNKRVGYFPSGAFAWRIKGEDFLKGSDAISELKLRFGYGQTGQQDLGTGLGGYYPYLANLGLSTLTAQYQLGFNADGSPRFLQTLRSNQYNPNITWETTTTYNVGLDYGFFGGRLYGSIDAYKRDTKDLLFFSNIGALSGLSNAGNFNIGSLTNKGFELVTNLDLVKGERLNITVNANGTFNHNEITKLSNSDTPDAIAQKVGGISGGVGNTVQVYSVGHTAPTFYLQQQVYGPNGQPLEGVYVDRDGNGTTTNDFYLGKNPRPQFLLGGGANATYRGFNLAFTLRANLGNYAYNNVRSQAFYDASSNGFVINRSRDILNTGFTTAQYYSDYYLENASFLRMQNATIGYNFGQLVKKGTNLSLSLAVQNVFVITKYTGLDPELLSFPPDQTVPNPTLGVDNTIYPRPRTFTVGLNLGI